jgi:hypothetical protein
VSLLNVWTPTDIANGQKQLLADATTTDQGVTTCTGADATTKAQWATFFADVKTYCAVVPVWFFPTGTNETITTGKLADQLQAYQRELFAWQQRLQGMKCSVLVNNPTPPSVAIDPSVVSAMRWGGVIAGSLAAAYVVGKISTTLNLFGTASVLRSSQKESRRVLRRYR